ncbi:DNA sulfur modification protein DndD [Aeromonas sobria]|uniref:DNA sulfur modification protein DndD n=1 Tax=Aeromonas sobria TaxID=646 RepID=A0A1S2CZP3_AERSO|nr:DNA sulfur modification protein DndD [Aeromonas sobria]MBS4688481.1 DNA sulfur modification protein DndD [Aeromonas sobria]OHY93599.1 DNA sulfur modification protein DndD [Aeromonas sobria]
MIIKSLTLHDFRVFRGCHRIDLTPRPRLLVDGSKLTDRPIVLFGGLNGAGKTSILTAIRLALYGRLAFDGLYSQQDYIDHLAALVHNGVSNTQRPNEASIELCFTYNKAGIESEFTVIRSWKRGKKDRLMLIQDGEAKDELNYEQCQGFLNELIPHGIADLFFFDGEKIAELAEDESGKVLKTAVRRLLGLDLVSKLRSDLGIYLKRVDAKSLGSQQQKRLATLEAECAQHGATAERLRFEADVHKTRIELLTIDIKKIEAQLAAEGGAFALTKAQEEQRVESLLKEKEQLEKQIRHEMEAYLPLSLAPNTLTQLLAQLETEASVKQTHHFTTELTRFLETLQGEVAFQSVQAGKIAAEAIESQLSRYLANKPQGTVRLDISEREFGVIEQLINQESQYAKARFCVARDRLQEVEQALEQAATNIARAPEDEQLFDIFKALRALDSKRQQEIHRYQQLLTEAKQALNKQLSAARDIQKLHDKERSQFNDNSAVHHAHETIKLLDEYTDVLTMARVKRLEAAFSIAYHKLARKEDLQIQARINPATFDVELIDEQGVSINRKLLSAGEKQIYAIAILEALAKTSGRQLPVIIDTPLGRLDSHHRDNLIEHYFPQASHQVVLLSTDTEVDQRYFAEQLSGDISHAYQIEFDSLMKCSYLKDGYFWKQKEAC